MRNRTWYILTLMLVVSMALAACGATPTATPVPPTATNTPAPAAPTATKPPAAATAAPAAATAAPAAATATTAPAAPTATKPPAGPTNTPLPAPAATGKTLVMANAAMVSLLNPFAIPGGQMSQMFRFTLVRLINLDDKGAFLPDLAEKWTVSSDKEYTFNLRKDVTWSDGSKLTSKDVATTFRLHCTKETGSNRFVILKVIEGCQDMYDGKATTVSGIKTPDDYTFVLKLSGANPGFFYTIPDVPIVPDAIFSKLAPKDITTSDYILKGPQLVAGPFSVKSFVPNEWIEFTANPKYYAGAPKLAGIIVKKIPDRNTRLLAFEKGEVDHTAEALAAEYDRIMKLPGISTQQYLATIGALWINYHLDKPNKTDAKYVAMGKKEFRQALAYAIDFQAFANIRTAGKPELFVPRTCFWTNGISGLGECDPTLTTYKYDPAKAQALLKQIGWDSKWEIDFAPYGLTPTPDLEALQQMWTKVGLNVKLRGMDPATFTAEGYSKGNFDITSLGLAPNSNMVDFYNRFRCGQYPYDATACPTCINLMRYCNTEFDKLLVTATTSIDPKVFEPAMATMTKMWNDELPIMTTGQDIAFLLLGAKVDGTSIKIGNAYSWDSPHLWAMK